MFILPAKATLSAGSALMDLSSLDWASKATVLPYQMMMMTVLVMVLVKVMVMLMVMVIMMVMVMVMVMVMDLSSLGATKATECHRRGGAVLFYKSVCTLCFTVHTGSHLCRGFFTLVHT